MLTIEREVDLVIDLKSANNSLISNKEIKSLYQEAMSEDGWEGILAVHGENFVIASLSGEWWEGEYSNSTTTERHGYDFNDDEVTYRANAFGELSTWQTISRFIEDGFFIVKYEGDGPARRFRVGSGKAEQL